MGDVLSELNPDIRGALFSVDGESTIAGGMTLEDEIASASVELPPPMSGKNSEGESAMGKKGLSFLLFSFHSNAPTFFMGRFFFVFFI